MRCTHLIFCACVFFTGTFIFSQIGFADRSSASPPKASSSSVEIMFYNVFNLFDAKHDQDKNDWTFLPKGYPGKAEYCETVSNSGYREQCVNSDWTEANVKLKLKQLKRAVKAARKRLPDILGLCEVENPKIVARLAKTLGYSKLAMTNSPDKRGIDVAVLYNPRSGLKLRKQSEHVIKIESSEDRPTRNILEVEFLVKNSHRLIVFINHWPSQGGPSRLRVNAARHLQKIIDRRLKSDPYVNIVLVGDFNTIADDYPHPFNTVTMSNKVRNPFIDVHNLFMKDRSISSALKKKMPLGTYFYPPKMSWDRLDRFFINRNLTNGAALEVEVDSYRILNPDLIVRTFVYDDEDYFDYGTTITRTPYRANIYTHDPKEAGYSDHFPIFLRLKVR